MSLGPEAYVFPELEKTQIFAWTRSLCTPKNHDFSNISPKSSSWYPNLLRDMKSESFCFKESFYHSPKPSKHQIYNVFKVVKVELVTFRKSHQNQFRLVQST